MRDLLYGIVFLLMAGGTLLIQGFLFNVGGREAPRIDAVVNLLAPTRWLQAWSADIRFLIVVACTLPLIFLFIAFSLWLGRRSGEI